MFNITNLWYPNFLKYMFNGNYIKQTAMGPSIESVANRLESFFCQTHTYINLMGK